jgi:hypothetical protein
MPISMRAYKVIDNNGAFLLNIPTLSGLKANKKVYFEKLANGCILIIPEDLY